MSLAPLDSVSQEREDRAEDLARHLEGLADQHAWLNRGAAMHAPGNISTCSAWREDSYLSWLPSSLSWTGC